MEDSDFLCNLNMSFFQHAKLFGSVSAYFSCVVSTGRDLTLPIKSSSAKKKKRKKGKKQLSCGNALPMLVPHLPKIAAHHSIFLYLLDVPLC